jgi:hypothetical protein
MKLHELLGTKDPKRQVEIVQSIVQAAQAPVYSLSLLFDSRTSDLSISSDKQLSFEVMYGMLDKARQIIQEKERELLLNRGNREPLDASGRDPEEIQEGANGKYGEATQEN